MPVSVRSVTFNLQISQASQLGRGCYMVFRAGRRVRFTCKGLHRSSPVPPSSTALPSTGCSPCAGCHSLFFIALPSAFTSCFPADCALYSQPSRSPVVYFARSLPPGSVRGRLASSLHACPLRHSHPARPAQVRGRRKHAYTSSAASYPAGKLAACTEL